MTAARVLEKGDVEAVEYCHVCKRPTRWIVGRGARFSKCESCADRFPCAHLCGHLDCDRARAVLDAPKEGAS